MLGKLEKINPNTGEPHSCPSDNGDCPICRIFGNTAKDKKYGPTRLIVSDCNLLSPEDKENTKKANLFA